MLANTNRNAASCPAGGTNVRQAIAITAESQVIVCCNSIESYAVYCIACRSDSEPRKKWCLRLSRHTSWRLAFARIRGDITTALTVMSSGAPFVAAQGARILTGSAIVVACTATG
jgi:hypothetical protein